MSTTEAGRGRVDHLAVRPHVVHPVPMVLLIIGLALLVVGLGLAVALDARSRAGALWPGAVVLATIFLGVGAMYLSAT